MIFYPLDIAFNFLYYIDLIYGFDKLENKLYNYQLMN